jgi:hypothetical protein
MTSEDLLMRLERVTIDGIELSWTKPERLEEFCRLFWAERSIGLISEGKQDVGIYVSLHLNSGSYTFFTVTETATETFAWITRYLEKDIIAGG